MLTKPSKEREIYGAKTTKLQCQKLDARIQGFFDMVCVLCDVPKAFD